MNVYWASQHYEDLAGIRRQQGVRVPANTPPFLLQAHLSAMGERAERGGNVDHKVRQIARRAMSQQARDPVGIPAQPPGRSRSGVEPGLKQADIESPHLADAGMPQQPMEAM
jgi:hypothetical protein